MSQMKNFTTMKWILITLLSLASIQMAAQPDELPEEKRREKIDALKRAYISDKLDLTVAEAEKFWPVYNEYDKKKSEVKKSINKTYKAIKAGGKSEQDVKQSIDYLTTKRKEEADLDAAFLKDCLPILGADKVIKLAGLPKEFQKELVQKIKERRQQRGMGPGGRRY
jgi:Spy/CpxP family protein refolding chaperone